MNKYLLQLLLAFDQILNALLAGYADETLSSRAYRMALKKQPVWGWTARGINMIFFWEADHCREAYNAEVTRRQLPPEFRSLIGKS